MDKNDLSTNGNYMLDTCITISSVNRSLDSSFKNTEKHKTLAGYVVKVYVFVCINIKLKTSCTSDSFKHLFNLTSYSHYLSDNIKKVIQLIIQSNVLFAGL